MKKDLGVTPKKYKINEHWQVNVNLTPEGSDTPEGAFLPTPGKKRAQPHTKLNECDH